MAVALTACTGRADIEALQDPQTCESCHPSHYEEWSGSMHAYASEDPLFRFLNQLGQEQTGGELGDFCVQCHAPLAVELGLTVDGLNLDDLDPKYKGVTCYFCHSVDGVEGTHNNPLTLAADGIMRGSIESPSRNGEHGSAYGVYQDRTTVESAQMCGSCHDIVTPAGVHIERTYHEWVETLYGNPEIATQNLTCGQCHMKGVDEPIAVQGNRRFPERRRHMHTFPAVDVALTPWPQQEQQLQLVQDELASVLNPQLCVSDFEGVATVTVDLEQLPAGHSFPSGAAADRRVWVELVAYEGDQVVWETGRVPDGVALRSTGDTNQWEFGDLHYDAQGAGTHFFWQVADYDSNLLEGPTSRSQNDPRWRDTHRIRTWQFSGQVDRVELRAWMRPFGLDIVDELEGYGLEDAASIRAAIPTFSLDSAALTWTTDLERSCVR